MVINVAVGVDDPFLEKRGFIGIGCDHLSGLNGTVDIGFAGTVATGKWQIASSVADVIRAFRPVYGNVRPTRLYTQRQTKAGTYCQYFIISHVSSPDGRDSSPLLFFLTQVGYQVNLTGWLYVYIIVGIWLRERTLAEALCSLRP